MPEPWYITVRPIPEEIVPGMRLGRGERDHDGAADRAELGVSDTWAGLVERAEPGVDLPEQLLHRGERLGGRGGNPRHRHHCAESDWTIFVALAQVKKSQDLPLAWKRLAADRVSRALNEGRPL